MRARHLPPSVLLILALPAPGRYPSAAPPALTEGLWTGVVGNRQFLLQLEISHLGVHGMLQVMRDNDKTFLVPQVLVYKLLAAFPPPVRHRSAASLRQPNLGR